MKITKLFFVFIIAFFSFNQYLELYSLVNFRSAFSAFLREVGSRILLILCILYFGTKDIRISLLLLLMFLIEMDKLNMDEVNANLVALMVTDSMLEERLTKIEKK